MRSSCLRLAALTTIILATIAAPALARTARTPSPTDAAYTADATAMTQLAKPVVAAYQTRSSASDPRYYSDGVWENGDSTCWPCNIGPAVADAVLARSDPSRLPVVIATFNRAIADHQMPNGSFAGDDNAGPIDTGFFVNELGEATAALGTALPSGTRARWVNSIVSGADYLISSGNVVWYANGNLNLAYTEVMYFAWRFTGEARFAAAYNASWNFVLHPPAPRWAGFGFKLARTSTGDPLRDDAGYLTESDGGAPGFDPEYAELQLDTAASLFVLSHDSRALDLMNVLMNMELPRVNSGDVLNATDGSRHSLLTPFMTSSLAILVHYGRPDLAHLLPAQTTEVSTQYGAFENMTSVDFYFGLSRWLSPVLLDSSGVPVTAPAGTAQSVNVAQSLSPLSLTRTHVR
jgi:hypothetical protein